MFQDCGYPMIVVSVPMCTHGVNFFVLDKNNAEKTFDSFTKKHSCKCQTCHVNCLLCLFLEAPTETFWFEKMSKFFWFNSFSEPRTKKK